MDRDIGGLDGWGKGSFRNDDNGNSGLTKLGLRDFNLSRGGKQRGSGLSLLVLKRWPLLYFTIILLPTFQL